MRSNKFFAGVLAFAVAVFLWPAAASAQIGVVVSATTPLAASTTLTIPLTSTVAAGSLLVLAGGYAAAPDPPTLSGCGTWSAGQNNNSGSFRGATFYCTVGGSSITSGTNITQTQSGAQRARICVIAYPPMVTTHDLTGGATGVGLAIAYTTGTAANASEIIVAPASWNTNEDIALDANYTFLCDVYDGNPETQVGERVIASTTPSTYSSVLSGGSPTPTWVVGYDSFLYTPGGVGGQTRRSLTGAGK